MSRALAKTALEIDHSELYAVTEEMIERFAYERIAAQVAHVREYAELHELYPEMEAYEEELIEGIASLARSAERLGDSSLEDRLNELIDGIM